MSLPDVRGLIESTLIAAGFDLIKADPAVVDVAEKFTIVFKDQVVLWAPLAILSTLTIVSVGPCVTNIIAPPASVSLSTYQAIIEGQLLAGYPPDTVQIFFDYVKPYLIDPLASAIETVFTTWASGLIIGSLFLTGNASAIAIVPPTIPPTATVTWVAGKWLSTANFVPPVAGAIKGLAIANLGGLANANQSYLYSYFDAVDKGIVQIMNAIPTALMLTPIVPVLVGPIGSPLPNTWTMQVS